VIATFPQTFERAVTDWARYKAALKAGAVPPQTYADVNAWFWEFPKLWQGIAPNWREAVNGRQPTAEQKAFAERVDRWIIHLRGDEVFVQPSGLGVVPLLVIAGILVAASFGVAGLEWAIGYNREQKNITRMIDGVTAGVLPPEVLQKAVAADKKSFLEQITGVLQTGSVIAIIAVLLLVAKPFWKGAGGQLGGK